MSASKQARSIADQVDQAIDGGTGSHLKSAGSHLREAASAASQAVSNGLGEAKPEVDAALAEAKRAGQAVIDEAKREAQMVADQGRHLLERSSDWVRERPATAIGLAVAGGFLLSMALRRR